MRHVTVIAVLLSSVLLAAVPARAQAPAYVVPPGNPFVTTPGARGEVYLFGMRNPFRWSFDRVTGDMLIGDVGGGVREEVDRLPAGAIAGRNLGWSCREGLVAGPNACTATGAVDPIYDYATPGGHAIVGGYVVRDTALPLWEGRYLFGDALQAPVSWLDLASPGTPNATGLSVSGLSSFGEDGEGHLYATSLGDGNVYRLRQVDAKTLAGDSIGKFDSPMAVAGPLGDPDRLFVAERGGTLKLRTGGQTYDFLSVSTTTDSERGLLSVAVAPDYAASGRVYVFYTDPNGDPQLDEFSRSASDPNRADPASRRPILTIPHRDAANHNGGTVQIGPDGYLYLSTGDGGGQGDPGNDAQRLDSLLGKVLRIDPRPGGAGGSPTPVPLGDVTGPVVRTRVPVRQRVLKLHGAVAYARCNEACRVTLSGQLRIGKRRYALNTVSRAAAADRRVRLKATLPLRARRALRRGLRNGGHPKVALSLRGRDTAGNLGTLKHATVRVRRR